MKSGGVMDKMKNRFTLFGDSISKGTVFDNDKIKFIKENIPYYIKQELNIEIENFSQYGQTLKRAIEKGLFDNYLASLNPKENNYAIICLGGNDADFDWKTVANTPFEKHTAKTPLDEFSKLLDNTIIKLKNSGVKVILSTIMPINSELFFENVIGKIADKNNVLKFLSNDLSNIHRVQECYNSEIIKSSYRTGCLLIDVRSQILQISDYLKYFCKDGIHPNENGYKFLSELYINEIKNIQNNHKKEIGNKFCLNEKFLNKDINVVSALI
jgi:acyl-CoA thioesterase I